MELEKIDNAENRVKELTKQETTDLFRSIVMGKDVTEWIDTSKGKFKIKFPRARDLEAAGKLTALRLNGIQAKSLEANIYEFMEEIAYLDVCVIDWPDWWKMAKKENPNFSWSDIPSDQFILEVYAKAYQFRNQIQKEINRDSDETNKGMASGGSNVASNEQGLFDGLKGESGANG